MTDDDNNPQAHDELEVLVRQLPRELAPPEELWPRIAARIAAPREAPVETLARRLPADAPPPAAVWAGVAARIGTRSARRPVAWLGAAAALAALAVWLTVTDRAPSDVSGPDTRTADTAFERSEPSAVFEPREPSVPLGAAWMLGSQEVPWEVATALQRNLTLVQSERLAIEQALERAPDDGDLRELWVHAYEAELELNDISGRTIMAYQRGSDI